MVITYRITACNILIISNYAEGGGHQMGYIHLYGDNSRYLGYLGIIKNEATLPQNMHQPNGILKLYFHESHLQIILDTLRNQNLTSIQYNTHSNMGSLIIDHRSASNNELAA